MTESTASADIQWQWCAFDKLKLTDLYEILKLRQAVFVIEQNCIYPDCDNLDSKSWHLLGWDPKSRKLAAYLRVVLAGYKYTEYSIGRVVTAPEFRARGLGRAVTSEALKRIEKNFGRVPIRISAQLYLERFYTGFDFRKVGESYLEDGIPHIEMLRKPPLK